MSSFLSTLVFLFLLYVQFRLPPNDDLFFCDDLEVSMSDSISFLLATFLFLTYVLLVDGRFVTLVVVSYGASDIFLVVGIM